MLSNALALAGAGVNINVRTALILFFVPYLGMFCYILASVKLLYFMPSKNDYCTTSKTAKTKGIVLGSNH